MQRWRLIRSGALERAMRNAGASSLILAAVAWAGACSDTNPPVGPEESDSAAVVSDPVSQASSVSLSTRSAAPRGGTLSLPTPQAVDGGTEVAYVSLPRRFVANGITATIRNQRTRDSVVVYVIDGGVDPVAVPAGLGDTLDVNVALSGGGTAHFSLKVPARRPPKVVRTHPPRGKRDVALNGRVVVVFSEPVASSTLTSTSVRLFRGTSAVAGAVQLLEGNAVAAAFVPSAPLAANTAYRLEVTPAVRDLDGDALVSAETVEFETGQLSIGPAASIQMSPDSMLTLVVGATYQVAATVLDAAGNVLTDEPITWSISGGDPNSVTVSPTGFLTALGDGGARVTASVGAVTKGLTVTVRANPAASVAVAPSPATLAVGDTIILVATVRDAAGRVINHPSVTWTSSAPEVATVASYDVGITGGAFATVTGVGQGSVTITAMSGTATGTATVSVGPPRPVASVTVTPASVTLLTQGTVQLSAMLQDAAGKVIAGRPITWTSDNAAVATVDANGLATGVSRGSAAVTATSEGVSDAATIAVATISFASVVAGYQHSCALTSDGAAYCWGANYAGQLGNGSTISSSVPVPVIGGLMFAAVSAGAYHTCGVTTSGAAYCWGSNHEGRLGDDSDVVNRLAPVAVSGGLTFAALSLGEYLTCGLTTNGAAYCWGYNAYGALGTGSTTPGRSSVPLAVTGGLTFSEVSAAGVIHACGLTIGGAAYCWGQNVVGQLGNGSSGEGVFSSAPVAVTGGLTFSAVSAGTASTCGLTSTGAAYCWGQNFDGQLGNGSTISSSVPVPVTGGLTFAALSLGWWHTCGLTTNGAAYCWGGNFDGQLGNGSSGEGVRSTVPVAVSGGLRFAAVSARERHTCGLTTGGVTYCWGGNRSGQLGNGSTTDSTVPVKVAGQP